VTETERSPAGVWDPRRRRLTLGLVLTISLVAFESLAIATVMPEVADDLGGLGLYGWVFSGFFLGNLVGVVAAGQAADARGTAPPFVTGLLLFSGGLLVGGLAPSMGVLVAARVAQGIGAGAIPAVAYASVARGYPPALRSRVFAIFSTAWVVPGLIGPAMSSAIAGVLGWRAVFLALLPIVAVAAAITVPALSRTAPEVDGERPPPAADLRGIAIVLVMGVAAVLIGLSGAPPVLAVALVVIGAPIAAWAFVRLVPPGTVRLAAGMPAAILLRGILTFAFFGGDAYVSLTLVDVRDQATWVAGIALTATTLAWTAGAWAQERLLGRSGPRRLVTVGFALVAVGTSLMFRALGPLPVVAAVAVWSVSGFGIGLAYACLSVTVLGLAEPGKEGAASASLQLSDVLGVSLGTGFGAACIAIGESRDWPTRSALTVTYAVTLVVALAGIGASRRLPDVVPS
jgi:MFS family permease